MCRGSRHIFIGKCASVNWSGDSLLPSRRFNPLYAVPPPSSEGGEGATAPPHRFNYCDKVHKIALPLQNVCARRTHLNILPQRGKIFHTRKARISPPQSGDFTRQRSCRISLSARAKPKHERRAAKEPRFALRKATVMRTKILSVTPVNPLGLTAPLTQGSREVCSVRLAEDRGAENAFNLPLRHRPLKMCAHGAHT